MIRLLNLIIALLLFNDLPSLIIQHPFFSDSLDSITVFVGLMLLGDCLTVLILPCAVLEEGLVPHFSIGTHGRTANVGLADIRTTVSRAMKFFVPI